MNALSDVIRILTRWQVYGPINTQSLLNFIIDQVLAVISEVKHKLLLKAIDKFGLLNKHMRSDTDGAPACAGPGPEATGTGNDDEQYIKEYPECPMAFDQMIITISQYFDLCNLNSYKLEDLWLNLMDVMCLDRPNRYTVFKAVHH